MVCWCKQQHGRGADITQATTKTKTRRYTQGIIARYQPLHRQARLTTKNSSDQLLSASRKSKGVYEITGTLGLRSEGWYLDTPNDRNGNKYFNIEWTQNITPDAVDGVVDEYRDDIVVTIETFERVWNPKRLASMRMALRWILMSCRTGLFRLRF